MPSYNPIQALYEYVFCTGKVHGPFGVFSMFPRELLPTTGPHEISRVVGVLAVEEDDSFPDPLTYLDTDVSMKVTLRQSIIM